MESGIPGTGRADELDEALERFQLGRCEYAGGLSNHGPMAAEALMQLGHRALVPGWVERYAPRLGPPEEPGRPMASTELAEALGRIERVADWIAHYEEALAHDPWPDVLERAVASLSDGMIAGATHGWLRAAHAVRALGSSDNAVRRRELAFGLGYWAARHQRLPGDPGARPEVGADPETAMTAVPVLPAERRVGGFFFDQVRALGGDREFERSVEAVDLDRFDSDPGAWIGALGLAGARRYLAHPGARIAYVHTVTSPSALRFVLPHLSSETARRAAGGLFQAAAALHAVAAPPAAVPGDGSVETDAEVEALSASTDEIRYRAACSLEEHSIKMSEACLREDAIAPDPLWRRAAADAALRIDSRAGRLC